MGKLMSDINPTLIAALGFVAGAAFNALLNHLVSALAWRRDRRNEALEAIADLVESCWPAEAIWTKFERDVTLLKARLLIASVNPTLVEDLVGAARAARRSARRDPQLRDEDNGPAEDGGDPWIMNAVASADLDRAITAVIYEIAPWYISAPKDMDSN